MLFMTNKKTPTVVDRRFRGTISTTMANTIPNHISAANRVKVKDRMTVVPIVATTALWEFTEKVGDPQRDHGPEGIKVQRAKGERCRDYLTDGQAGHARADSHFRHELVADYPADHHADAADNDRDGEEPPAEVVIREVIPVV